MVLTGQALRSLRDSGYDLSAALAEPVDNSLEAEANSIVILLQDDDRRKRRIHEIAVIDDGCGMNPDILQHYLQLGFSTRYMSKETIGKFGVGAKLAALNYGMRIDVWSRTSANDTWLHAYFDLEEAEEEERRGGDVGIDEPDDRPIPAHLADYASDASGTVVVWSKVDRLEEGRLAADANELRVEVQRELCRIFRYFLLGGIKITINGTALIPHDPLFREAATWANHVLGGHYPAMQIANADVQVGSASAKVRVTVYPKEVVRDRGKGGDKLSQKLRVPENQGALSFVRMDREISYTTVPKILPSGVEDADRFIGIEVSFRPGLDEYFGVRNVKRGVEPHGELRQKIREVLKRYIPTARTMIQEMWGESQRENRDKTGEHGEMEDALKDVDRTMPKGRVLDGERDIEKEYEDLVKDVGLEDEEQKQEYKARIRNLPFVIESVDFPGSNFIDVRHLDDQVIIRLNTRHPFYREMWEPLSGISQMSAAMVSGEQAVKASRRCVEAMTLMIAAYGKAESMDENPREKYGDLRNFWGQFLDTLMVRIKDA
jgi:hypothetical protein